MLIANETLRKRIMSKVGIMFAIEYRYYNQMHDLFEIFINVRRSYAG